MFEEIVGTSKPLRRVFGNTSRKSLRRNQLFLITGETGTGKELIARAIHKRSSRANKPFIRINLCCHTTISRRIGVIWARKRALFTGATQRRHGPEFEMADGGTLFLDEIGELPLDTQISLLRVLQEREIERLGGTEVIPVDVRFIAATNRDLQVAIDEGTFRQDLF